MSYLQGGKYLGSTKSNSPVKNGIILLAITHFVALWGIKSDLYSEFFVPLIPVNILLCLAVLLYYQKYWSVRAVLFLFVTYASAFVLQTIGDRTDYLFGPFRFGWSLGPSLFGTPLVAGVIWVVAIYCSGMMIKNLAFTIYQKAALGGVMVMLFDIVLEPIARQYKMWDWMTKKDPGALYNPVPIQNYLAWFLFSFLIMIYFFSARAKLRNPIAPGVIIVFILFLFAMHIFR